MTTYAIKSGVAQCLTVSKSIVDNDNDAELPDPLISKLCEMCPVQVECLILGLTVDAALGQGFGIWGGLTAYQRSLIVNPHTEAAPMPIKHCPGCAASELLISDTDVTCLSCELTFGRM